jgi:hypothetical protein
LYYNIIYKFQIIIATCIFLSAKINDDSKRIRDIVNVIYFVNSRHEKISNCENNQEIKDEIYYNLKNDNYLADEDSTLVKTIGQLTLENVKLFLFLISIILSERIFYILKYIF